MKKKYLLLIILPLISCVQQQDSQENNCETEYFIETVREPDPTIISIEDDCVSEFRKLRDYIYHTRKDSLMQYFSFPDIANNDAFWYLSLAGYDSELYRQKHTAIFTEENFSNYFDRLFSHQFVKSLLKIKSKELFETGKYSTIHFTEQDTYYVIEYWIDAVYDKETKILKLQLNNYGYDGENRIGESLIEYRFIYDDNCNLRFYELILAG